MYIFGFGGKIEIHCTVRSIVRSTHAVGTTLAAPMAAPVNLAGLRDQLQKGRVFDSREAFVKAVQLCATVPRRGVKQYRRDTPNGGCLFAASAVCTGDRYGCRPG